MHKVFTIIVTFNASKWINKCFSGLLNSDYPTQVIVVDNNSSDNTPQIIKTAFPEVEVVEAGENLGFAKANNIGMKMALDRNADYVFLLNQDAWVENDTIGKLVDSFSFAKNIGIVSPVHMNGAGTDLDKNFSLFMPSGFISDAYLNKLKDFYYSNYVNAAAWMLSAGCIRKIGGFDTLLFSHYGEDENYCQRVEYHGYKLIVNTSTKIYHDRENRGNEDQYRNSIWKKKNAELWEKMSLGNVNQPFNYNALRKSNERSILINLLLLRFAKVKKLKERRCLFQQINISRLKNITIGNNWLE